MSGDAGGAVKASGNGGGARRARKGGKARAHKAAREKARAREARLAQEVAARAARRLDLLEWVMLAGMAGLATAGGFVVALLLSGTTGLSFRPTWVVASLVVFAVPGAIAVRRIRRDERELAAKVAELTGKNRTTID